MRKTGGWRRLLGLGAALALGAHPALGQQQGAGRPMTLSFERADIRQALKQMFQSAGLNYALDPKVHGTVTTTLKEVPFRVALETVLRSGNPDQPLTYRLENGVYSIAPVAEAGEADLPSMTVKVLVNSASAEAIVKQLKQQAPYRETPAFTYQAYPADNTIIVSGSENQIRMMKEGIRFLDVLPRQISVKAELILVADGDDARTKGRIIWSPVIRGLAGQEMAVRTEVKNGSDSAWLGGTNSLKLRARVNGDNTISLDADWEADLSIRVSGMAGPLHIVHTASGALRMASGETQVLTGAIVKLGGKGPDSQLLLFLTPAQVYDSQETGPSNPDTNKQP